MAIATTTLAIEKAKLILLFSIFFSSLSTLFTTNHTNPKGIPQLNIKPSKICRVPQQKLSMSTCATKSIAQRRINGDIDSDSDSSDSKDSAGKTARNNVRETSKKECSILKKQLQKCQKYASKSLKYINTIGCIKEINTLSICKDECYATEPGGCERECKSLLDNVNTCLDKRIKEYFLKVGLNDDGTYKRQQ